MSDRPLPRPTALSKPHWEGCQQGELRVQRCADCGAHIFIPQQACTSCLSDNLEWVKSKGLGVVYSCSTVYRPQQMGLEVPYTVAIVELEEGWHILTNVIDCPHEEIAIGLPVEVSFVKMSDEITLPMFIRRAG